MNEDNEIAEPTPSTSGECLGSGENVLNKVENDSVVDDSKNEPDVEGSGSVRCDKVETVDCVEDKKADIAAPEYPKEFATVCSPAETVKRKQRKKKSDVVLHSSNSSCNDSLRRTKRSVRNPLLITLSSENDSESDAKGQSNSENEDAKHRLARRKTNKRVAHCQADYRRMATARWAKQRKKMGENSSDSSSTTSMMSKTKKRNGRNSIAPKVPFGRKHYFAAKNLCRNKRLAVRNNIPFLRARGHRKKVEQKHMVVQKRPVGRPPRDSQHNVTRHLPQSSHRRLPYSPGKRGRPRKCISNAVSNELLSEFAKDGSNDDKTDNKVLSDDDSSRMSTSKSESSEKRTVESENSTVVVKKRGRKLGMKLSKLHVNKKIKPFLQNMSCFDIIPRVSKCRECRLVAYNKTSKKHQNSYCRFLEYRKLCYAKNGTILNAGFSLATDCTEEDIRMWLPRPDSPPEDLNRDNAKALLIQVGDQFCDLIEQEKEALSLHIGSDKTLTWKRIVQGVREMCDVCDTTLFNIHWVCPKCGIAVCIDCYKVRKQGIVVENEEGPMKGRDEYMWFLCNGRQPHELDKLIMTQIVPGNALWTMQEAMHRARDACKIVSYCKCKPEVNSVDKSKNIPTGICQQLMSSVLTSFSSNHQSQPNYYDPYIDDGQPPKLDLEINESALNWLNNDDDSSDSYEEPSLGYENGNSDNGVCFNPCYESFASLKNMLLQGSPEQPLPPSSYLSFSLDDIIQSVIEVKAEKAKVKSEQDTIQLFNHRYPQPNSGRDPLPIRIFTKTESSIIYNDVPHSWLCNGRLLLLHYPKHEGNLLLFQEQWKRGQPIMVMGVDKCLDMSLWHPDGFSRDFGEVKNDLVNCKTGAIIPNLPMRKFWEGFENFEKRMKDDFGEYMLLKLKDWPPGEDFSEKLPKRFQDLMKGLPLPEYTHRDGIFNLAGRLPSWFVRPDLGPKMYNAYGSALFPTKGTTNLHLDISDAVNVMVYVGVPHDGKAEEHIQEALKAIDEGGCDSLMRKRVRSRGVRPGALWHIYNARDADKIRDMLTKVAVERGEKLEAHHDPIHDQSWYIDSELRKRLYHEYGVEGYAIAQCLGDAVFIPAGAPHQVRNLHSCVKVAEDFVSPENIGHCFKLTQEFRHLSDTHTNHEDKLQIKNIIYHVVKDSLSHLLDKDAAEHYRLSEPKL